MEIEIECNLALHEGGDGRDEGLVLPDGTDARVRACQTNETRGGR